MCVLRMLDESAARGNFFFQQLYTSFYGIFFGSTCDTSADILVLVMSPFLSGYDCAGSWLVQPHLVVARVWAG